MAVSPAAEAALWKQDRAAVNMAFSWHSSCAAKAPEGRAQHMAPAGEGDVPGPEGPV